ncbi:MAG TPA: alpha/beta hydrolase, partial [Candidatus Kapabacteria bacterium]|nr:alpha/beta hydrolase [Candidatus Kapabacteria bacterium]
MIHLTRHTAHETSRTLVMLHAFPFSSKMWNELIPLLQDENVNIVTVDIAGFGGASRAEWSMSSITQALNGSLTQENITKPVLCGLSMGGYIALAYSKQYPDQVGGLILADTKSAADADEVKQDREKFALDALGRGAIASVERNLDKMT